MANASDTSVSDASVCAGVPQSKPLELACNLGPCEVYTWSVGAWSACDAACGGESPHPLKAIEPQNADHPRKVTPGDLQGIESFSEASMT